MRCFIAIDLPEEARKELEKIQEQLKSPDTKAKWVKPEQIHLTLKFLGELTDSQVNKVKDLLKGITFEPLKVKLNALGTFPTQTFVRVIWIDILPKEKLVELHEKIDSTLSEQGFRKEKRGFETHLTLARVKSIKDKQALIEKLKEIKVRPIEFEIKNFKLKKSTLTKEGPIYEDIIAF